MKINLKTGFFSYESCDLTLSGRNLLLVHDNSEQNKIISLAKIRNLTVNRERDGTCRLEMISDGETLEALVMSEDSENLSELLNAIAGKHRKIEFRMTGEFE